MPQGLSRILALEVPIIVQLGERAMPMGDVLSLIPGAIIELPKGASEELELLVNNKVIGTGSAVKVGENFGLKISVIGDAKNRIHAMGGADTPPVMDAAPDATAGGSDEDAALAALAEQLLSGQS
jgi:flagellar motor switch protein FliN/FliY